MTEIFQLHQIARLPMPGDNVAIATHNLSAGTQVAYNKVHFFLDRPILEGHRFAVQTIPAGAPLLSWGLPF